MNPGLVGHDVLALVRGETVLCGPDGIWEGDGRLGVKLTIKIEDVEHEVSLEMDVDGAGCRYTSCCCETLELTKGSALHEWIGAQVDDVWAAATA